MHIKRLSRREALGMLGVAGAAAASLGCGSSGAVTTATSTTSGTTAGGSGAGAACAVTPTETIGPYPSLTNFVRGDIREGKSGTPLTLTLTVVNTNNSCAPVAGAAVDIWHSDGPGARASPASGATSKTSRSWRPTPRSTSSPVSRTAPARPTCAASRPPAPAAR